MDSDSVKMDYPLHRCIFHGDLKTLSSLIRKYDISEKDKHGMFV